jgi:hypothetical protein
LLSAGGGGTLVWWRETCRFRWCYSWLFGGCKVVLVLVFGFLLFVFVMLLFMLGSCG